MAGRQDPDGPGTKGALFGLESGFHDAGIVLIPVPWEVTTSFMDGTKNGPTAIREASNQVDLHIPFIENSTSLSVHLLPENELISALNDEYRLLAVEHMNALQNPALTTSDKKRVTKINSACEQMVDFVYNKSGNILNKGKFAGVIGGDHSTALGLMKSIGDKYNSISILQIDAHADLRENYGGFTYSHASIMHNALRIPNMKRLVQVGVRDFSQGEEKVIHSADGRVIMHSDHQIKDALFANTSWSEICDNILKELGDLVYVSFDIDGLQPHLCPNTGTPVPGGLSFEMAVHLLKRLVLAGKRIIGFDLCEVAPASKMDDNWDAIVGSRMLYYLCCLSGASNQLLGPIDV